MAGNWQGTKFARQKQNILISLSIFPKEKRQQNASMMNAVPVISTVPFGSGRFKSCLHCSLIVNYSMGRQMTNDLTLHTPHYR
jgi:hypothetical protein